jgi:hypothetical protein
MHDYPFSLHDDDKPPRASPDMRTRDGRLMRDTRNAMLAEFPGADELRLREAVLLNIALARLQSAVLAGDPTSIATLAKLSNRLDRLRRKLAASAAKHKESLPC